MGEIAIRQKPIDFLGKIAVLWRRGSSGRTGLDFGSPQFHRGEMVDLAGRYRQPNPVDFIGNIDILGRSNNGRPKMTNFRPSPNYDAGNNQFPIAKSPIDSRQLIS